MWMQYLFVHLHDSRMDGLGGHTNRCRRVSTCLTIKGVRSSEEGCHEHRGTIKQFCEPQECPDRAPEHVPKEQHLGVRRFRGSM